MLKWHCVCACTPCMRGAHAIQRSTLRRTASHGATDLPSDGARRAEWVGGLAGWAGRGLLDLSCQPFTHNVSFMNAPCADLIPFSTG